MKKIISTILLALVVNIAFSQIGDSEKTEESTTLGIADKMVGLPKLVYYSNEGESKRYRLLYYNLEYPTIKEVASVGFDATSSELEYLYDFFKSGFETKETQKLTVGESTIYIKKVASSIRINVSTPTEIDSWFYLSKKQIDKLFGKR